MSNKNLSEFASVAARDLKAPLSTIINFSQLLSYRYQELVDPQEKPFFEMIISDAARLQTMISELLQYSRVTHLGLKPCDLRSIVESSLDALQMIIDDKKAVIRIPDSNPTVAAYPSLLVQVFQNILANALKFSWDHSAPDITISWRDYDGDFLLVEVADCGIGIDEEYADIIFQPFRRGPTASSYQGNGIGLATCRKVIESSGGRIWVSGNDAGGATFYFTLRKYNREEWDTADMLAQGQHDQARLELVKNPIKSR